MKLTGRKRKTLIAASATMALVMAAGVASAAVNTIEGGDFLYKRSRVSTDATATTSPAWTVVPGAEVTVDTGSAFRTLEARYTAESRCTGPTPGQWCSVRIIARNLATNVVSELYPRSGRDFAFDSVGATDDAFEGNAMARSTVLQGRHRIQVEYAVSHAGPMFRLDDWHFVVDTHEGPAVP